MALCPVQVRRRPAASPGPSARRSAPASTPLSAAATSTSRPCPRGSPRTSQSCEWWASAQALPPALQLWVGGLCCRVAGIGAEMLPPTPPPQPGSGNRTLTQPRDAVRPQPQQGAQREPLGQLRATKGDVQGVLSQQLGPCSLALERGQCGTATPCSCGPHAAVEPRALRSPAACHQRQGQGLASASSLGPLCCHLSPQLRGCSW